MENKYSYKNEPFKLSDAFKSNPLNIIGWYLVLYVFGVILALAFVCLIVSKNNNISFAETFKIGLGTNSTPLYYEITGYSNLISYLTMFIVLIYVGRSYLKLDIKKFYENKDKNNIIINIILIVISALLFALISYLANLAGTVILKKLNYFGTSSNENTIKNLIVYSNKILMGIEIVILAPVVEELVYRKSIFELSKNMNKIIRIILCAILFTLPHMISTQNVTVAVWFVLFSIYFISGLLLALIYQLFNENIYASLLAHSVNNLVAYIGYIK